MLIRVNIPIPSVFSICENKVLQTFVKSSTRLFRFWDIRAILQPQGYRLHRLQPQHTYNIKNYWYTTEYSQTWAYDHLRTATTCLHRPLFLGPTFDVHSRKVLLNNDHLSATASIFGEQKLFVLHRFGCMYR